MKDTLTPPTMPARRPPASTFSNRTATQFPIATRLAVAGVLGMALFSVLLLRLWGLTVLSGDTYEKQAQANQLRQFPVEAMRGKILARDGKPLVTNRAAREVVIDIQDVPKERRPDLYADLALVLDMPVREIETKVRRHTDPLTPVVVVDDLPEDNFVLHHLREKDENFPGVRVRARFMRSYVDAEAAAQIVGQVGEVSPKQLKTTYSNLNPGDRVGLSGLEQWYDPHLRGHDGSESKEVDASGVQRGTGRTMPAVPGNDLQLSIDLDLQRATEKALREGIDIAHKSGDGPRAYAAAAVAVDPRNGEVLALTSTPSYDPNIFVMPGRDREIERLLGDKRTPLSNRAISGLYPPGSIFKPVVGLAAMKERFITAETLITCPTFLDIAGTKFNNWSDVPLGGINLEQALEVSCDTYFYKLALDFYNTPGSRLQDWTRKFGFGQPTGIDLPGEEDGLIPTPSWRKKTFDGQEALWGPGHSVNLSIGQGDLLVTPLQMTMLYSAIANGGTMYTPRLAKSINDPGGKQLVKLSGTESQKLGVTEEELKPIKEGLYRAANGTSGTSTAIFAGFEVETAGKTGTAEKPPYGDQAWYCGYAPVNNPTIAACALVESGGHGGTAAAPVVLRMFQNYFNAKGGTMFIPKKKSE